MKHVQLTPNQRRGSLRGGWVLDGMDSFIYALVMVPALRELLPRSGIASDQSHVGYYGGLLFALFLIGWVVARWDPSQIFGRVRSHVHDSLLFSVHFLGAFVETFGCSQS
jgi:hypothetical protein